MFDEYEEPFETQWDKFSKEYGKFEDILEKLHPNYIICGMLKIYSLCKEPYI